MPSAAQHFILVSMTDAAGFSAEECIGLLVSSLQTSIPQLQQNLSRPQLQVPGNLSVLAQPEHACVSANKLSSCPEVCYASQLHHVLS